MWNLERRLKSMTSRSNILQSVFILFLFAQCQAQRNSSSSHYEDLSGYRPRVTYTESKTKVDSSKAEAKTNVTPTKYVNEKVDAVLDSIDRFNQTRKFLDGFTILLYSGQKKNEAMEAKKKMVAQVPGLISTMQYQQPTFRVTVGKYFTRIEAQKDLVILRQAFPNATLIPEKILIK